MYFVIDYVTVAELTKTGNLKLLGDLVESQVLPSAPDEPRGWDSSRECLYIALSDKTRLLEIYANGDCCLAGQETPDQALTWTGNNWEIESDASEAWLNIDGARPAELNNSGDLLLINNVLPYQTFSALPELLTLTHAIAGDYEFPQMTDQPQGAFWFETIPTKTRVRESNRAGRHGVKDSGDGFYSERIIEIRGFLKALTNNAYETAKDALYRAITREDLELWTNFDRYLPLKRLDGSVQEKFLKGFFQRGSEWRIKFLMENPFWVSATLTQNTEAITTNPETYYITYNGSVDAHPIIKITAGEDIPNLQIANVTDSREFTYADAAFLNGEEVHFDCDLGTVTLVGAGTPNRIDKFDGPWLRLIPGNNEIRVTGTTSATVIVEYRERYL